MELNEPSIDWSITLTKSLVISCNRYLNLIKDNDERCQIDFTSAKSETAAVERLIVEIPETDDFGMTEETLRRGVTRLEMIMRAASISLHTALSLSLMEQHCNILKNDFTKDLVHFDTITYTQLFNAMSNAVNARAIREENLKAAYTCLDSRLKRLSNLFAVYTTDRLLPLHVCVDIFSTLTEEFVNIKPNLRPVETRVLSPSVEKLGSAEIRWPEIVSIPAESTTTLTFIIDTINYYIYEPTYDNNPVPILRTNFLYFEFFNSQFTDDLNNNIYGSVMERYIRDVRDLPLLPFVYDCTDYAPACVKVQEFMQIQCPVGCVYPFDEKLFEYEFCEDYGLASCVQFCEPAPRGYRTEDDRPVKCPEWNDVYNYYLAETQTQEGCISKCGPEDMYMLPDGLITKLCTFSKWGEYSPNCDQENYQCTPVTNSRMPPQFMYIASSGRGTPNCRMALTAQMMIAPRTEIVDALKNIGAPFSVEFWAYISSQTGQIFGIPKAIIGYYPMWYFGHTVTSNDEISFAFYHQKYTASNISKNNSILLFDPLSLYIYGDRWIHIVMTLSDIDIVFIDNIILYINGYIHSKKTLNTNREQNINPNNLIYFYEYFHIGGSAITQDHKGEIDNIYLPYYDASYKSFLHNIKLTDIKVHSSILPIHIIKYRQIQSSKYCSPDSETELTEGICILMKQPLTGANSNSDRTECNENYSTCPIRPGICMPICETNCFGNNCAVRLPDCTCDCPADFFQSWYTSKIELTGTGYIVNATAYDANLAPLRTLIDTEGNTLNLRNNLSFLFSPAATVAVVEVFKTSLEINLSMIITRADGRASYYPYSRIDYPVTRAESSIYLHHKDGGSDYESDDSMRCAPCPSISVGSILPRTNLRSCACPDGFGINRMGRCVLLKDPIPPLKVTIEERYTGTQIPGYEAKPGSLVILSQGDGSPEGEIDFYYTLDESTPTSLSNLYTTPLDFIQPSTTTTIKVLGIHSEHWPSDVNTVAIKGLAYLRPATIEVSDDEGLTWHLGHRGPFELKVAVRIVHEDPSTTLLYFEGDDPNSAAEQTTDGSPFNIYKTTKITTWATKPDHVESVTTIIEIFVEIEAISHPIIDWEDTVFIGYSNDDYGYLLDPNLYNIIWTIKCSGIDCDIKYYKIGGSLIDIGIDYIDIDEKDWELIDDRDGYTKTFQIEHFTVNAFPEGPPIHSVADFYFSIKQDGYRWSTPARHRVIIAATRAPPPHITINYIDDFFDADDPWSEQNLNENNQKSDIIFNLDFDDDHAVKYNVLPLTDNEKVNFFIIFLYFFYFFEKIYENIFFIKK
eukprot:GHVL01022349.1.p1 GENE.GHVL01022349.1~~GHVL01022349.1.p1  ORF type:complete len:1306 (+),score=278.90 GHVL01022349.1:838-4755(+)